LKGTVAGKPHAIIFCIVGTICNAAMMTFSGKLLSEKLDVVRLTFYTAPISLVCLAPFMIYMELDEFRLYFAEHFNDVLGIILLSSVNAVTYNLVHSLMIKRSSAVTTTVLGEIKIVGLLILSALVLDEGKEFTPKMLLGCLLAMAGFLMYSQTKIDKLRSSSGERATLPSISREASASSFEREPLKD
jgi:drug/metabolite transporter (DMT)-like permease